MTNNSTKSRKGYKSKFDSLGLVRSRMGLRKLYSMYTHFLDTRPPVSLILVTWQPMTDQALRAPKRESRATISATLKSARSVYLPQYNTSPPIVM